MLNFEKIFLISFIALVLLCSVFTACSGVSNEPATPPSVPAAPNDSIVTAKVISVQSVTGNYPWQITIEIQKSQDVPGNANGTSEKIGQQISVYTSENAQSLKAGQIINANVKF